MRYLILILFLTGCGSGYHARQFKKHLDKAIEKGARLDTILQVKRDTVFLKVVKDSVVIKHIVDVSKLDSLCKELLKESDTVKITEKKKTIVKTIWKSVCAPIDKDTTYHLSLTAKGLKYELPIRVKISNQFEKLTYSLISGELKVPLVTETHAINVHTGKSFKDFVHWFIIVFVCGIITGIVFKHIIQK
jgi:hypothetical protein